LETEITGKRLLSYEKDFPAFSRLAWDAFFFGGYKVQRGIKPFFRSAILALLVTFAAIYAHAQATSGQIAGQVTDATGAVIPGAEITLIDLEKGVTFKGVSDGAGNYTVVSVPPGIYSVIATAPGFATSKYASVVLAIDQHMPLNFKLAIGNVSASVEVNDAPPVLQSQSAEVGTVISGDAISGLPLLGRNFYDLTTLVPGVAVVGGSINSFAVSVSGQREYANSIQLDGIESTTNRTQDVTVKPNVDSVDQFKVVTAAYNAEFGNAAGGVIAVQTKAGTNKIHGDAFEFYRPAFLTAKQTIPGVGTPQPASKLDQNNFGGTIGGPIVKDKSFLFAAYEGMRNSDTWNYITSTIPFQLFNVMPNGNVDFSGLVDPCAGKQCTDSHGNPSGPTAGTVDPIFDPNQTVANYGWWSSQFQGNIIPSNRVSTAGMNTMMNFFPKPNLPGTHNGWFRNFQAHAPVTQNSDQVDARYDQVITPKDRLYAVFHWQGYNYLANDAFYGEKVVPGAGDADQATKENLDSQSLSLTYDRFVSPTSLNEVRFGYLRYQQGQYSLLNGTDYSTKYGYGNVAVPGYSATIGFPQIYMADGFLAGGSTWKPYHVLDNNLQMSDAYTWTGVSRHEFKFGADLRLLNSNPNFSLFPTGFDYFGSWGYAETAAAAWWGYYYCADPSWCVDQGWNWLGGSDVADLALGLPMSVDMGLQLTNPHTKSWNMDYFAQDSFKITPKLTMNYGIRYEFQDPWTEAHNNMSNYDLASGNIVLAGRNGVSRGIIQPRKNDYSPRLGFAYSVDQKTVLRAGGAIFFSPENDGREDFMTKNNPFATQASYSNWPWSVAPSTPQVWPYQLDNGVKRNTTITIPPAGYINPKDLADGNLVATYAANPHIKTGATGSFNAAVERQLNRTIALDVSYVGSISRHLSYLLGDINADPNKASPYDGLITPYLGQIQYLDDLGSASYNSLQVKLTQQASRNTAFLLSYTYGHSLDNGPAPFNLGHINNNMPQNPHNLAAEWATSDSDLRHNFVFSGDYLLPFGKGQRFGSGWGSVADAIVGGWKFGGIFSMHTGTPVNVVLGNDPKSALAGVRPDITGDPNLPHGKRTVFQYFNTGAFSKPTIPHGQSFAYGNAGRNLIVGPGYINVDAALSKEFSLHEQWKLQVRAEAFNAMNSVHYSNPDGNLSSGTFGQINYTMGDNRKAQLAAKLIF
jgi:hypothetical protein